MTGIVFLDTETTSLHPDTRRAWDIYLIRREIDGTESHHGIIVADIDLSHADQYSLKIGQFWSRHPLARATPASRHEMMTRLYESQIIKYEHAEHPCENYDVMLEADAAVLVQHLTRDAVLVGACPWVDAHHLAQLLYDHQLIPTWHHRMIDVYSLMAGHLNYWPERPWEALESLGMCMSTYPVHTAYGDVSWVRDAYDRINIHHHMAQKDK